MVSELSVFGSIVFAYGGLVCHSHLETYGDDEMHKALVAGIVGVGLLAGCTISRPSGIPMMINIEGQQTLIGNLVVTSVYTGAGLLEKQGMAYEGYVQVTDGRISCKSPALNFRGMTIEAITIPISCDDGSDGTILMQTTGETLQGAVGNGEMTNGSRVRAVWPVTGATLAWN